MVQSSSALTTRKFIIFGHYSMRSLDFVGCLKDGRIFAVEYKNVALWSNDDSREKRPIGELWAAASKGKCVFAMPQGPDWPALYTIFRNQATINQ